MPRESIMYASDVERWIKGEKWLGEVMVCYDDAHTCLLRVAKLLRKTGLKARVVTLPDTGLLGMVKRSVLIMPQRQEIATATQNRLINIAYVLQNKY